MVGLVSGVSTRLKCLNPEMLSIHCINHRLAVGVWNPGTNNRLPLSTGNWGPPHKFTDVLYSPLLFVYYSFSESIKNKVIKGHEGVLHEWESIVNRVARKEVGEK